jgi:hypothetical protein
VCMPFRWWSNLCTPPWITHSSIFGNGGFALAATMYLSIQLFEIQILNGIFALIQNPLRLRQTSNNESCSKLSILDFRCFLDFPTLFAIYSEQEPEIWIYLILKTIIPMWARLSIAIFI